MAKALKTKKRKVVPRKAVGSCVPRDRKDEFVVVGTYKDRQRAWIEKNGVYNYPVREGDDFNDAALRAVKELWLYADVKSTQYAFAVTGYLGKMTKQEFVAKYPTYAKLPSPKPPAKSSSPKNKISVLAKSENRAYYVFKVTKLDYKPTVNTEIVIARTADFGKRSAKVKKAIEQFKQDGEFAPLSAYLPKDLSQVPKDQLRVCEEAVQLDFYPVLLKPMVLVGPARRAKPQFSFFDLFAGCGGLSLGLERAGFTPLLVNELNPDALSTYLLNRKDEFPWLCDNNVSNVKDLVLNEDLLDGFQRSILKEFGIDIYNGQLDLICGGPPCQGFSGLGIRRSYSVEKKQLPSNYLYQDMAFLVNRIRPKIFLFENVRGLLSAKWTDKGEKGEIFKDVLKTFRDIGAYHVRYKLVHAKDYGVPQNRPRILIVGLRKDVFPEPATNGDAVSDGFLPAPVGGYPSIEELLSDLMDARYQRGTTTERYPRQPQNEVQRRLRTKRDGTVFAAGDAVSEMEYSNHSDYIVEKFTEMIRNGGEIPERFKTKKFAQKVLPRTWGKDGPTITACSAPDDYVHFAQPRSLTVREWARLQTFPDWYVFAGKRTTGGLRRAGNPREGIFDRELPKYTQVGNAVPVELAYNVGRHFVRLLTARAKHHA